MSRSPAVLIAGTHSGCGKTTVTLGIMAALQKRGLDIQPFKSGPDFIDPTLHRMVTGKLSRNLDVKMCGEEFVRTTFQLHSAQSDCAVLEGVMGLFDGGQGSAATLATLLDIPVILVVDVRSAAESVAAVIKGFATLKPEVRVAGVICNRVGSEKHRQMIADAVREHCDIPIIGFVPRNDEITIPSRHLGLHMGDEHPLRHGGLDTLIDLLETHLDLDLLLRLAGEKTDAPTVVRKHAPASQCSAPPVRIGVARDEAFCFYYEDNLDMLSRAGAEIVFFSPLREESLPTGLDGIYLGGGYPELHAEKLSANRSMRKAIFAFCEKGRPVYAECGGFMYLTRSITDQDGSIHPMSGVFPFASEMQPRLRRLGYRQPKVVRDTILAPEGAVLHGHEFHYSAVVSGNEDFPCSYTLDDGRSEGYTYKNTLAGYVHLHWGRTPEVAEHFIKACRQP